MANTSPSCMSPSKWRITSLQVKCRVPTWDGDILVALGRAFAGCVVQCARKVAVVDHEGIAGPQDLLGHLIDAGDERVLENLEVTGSRETSPAIGSVFHANDDVEIFVDLGARAGRNHGRGIELLDDRGPWKRKAAGQGACGRRRGCRGPRPRTRPDGVRSAPAQGRSARGPRRPPSERCRSPSG